MCLDWLSCTDFLLSAVGLLQAASGRRDLAVHIPKRIPALAILPEKDLAFDQAAFAVEAGDRAHLLVAEWIADDALEVVAIVMNGKRDG